MFCPKCGTQNEDTAAACSQCQYPLAQLRQGEKTELTQEELYQAAIGNKNQDYYLKRFKKFDAEGKISPTWHWSALFVAFYWFLYRKMWPHAIFYFFIPYAAMFIIGILGAILGESYGAIVAVLTLVFYVALLILPALFANALYYKHCNKKIAEVTAKKLSVERTIGEITGNGGTSGVALIFVLIFVFIAVIGILAAIAIPAYQNYTIKARLAQTYAIEQEVALAVDNYYNQHQTLPANLAEAGYSTPLPPHIKSITIQPENGSLVATLAGAQIENKTLLLVPTKDESGNIVWKCQTGTNNSDVIHNRLLPSACK